MSNLSQSLTEDFSDGYVAAILDRAARAGIDVWRKGDKIEAEGLETHEWQAVIDLLLEHKPEVMAYLARKQRENTVMFWKGPHQSGMVAFTIGGSKLQGTFDNVEAAEQMKAVGAMLVYYHYGKEAIQKVEQDGPPAAA